MEKLAAALLIFGIASGTAFAAPLASNEAYVLKNGLETWTSAGDYLGLSETLSIGDKGL